MNWPPWPRGLPAAPHKVRLLVARDGKITCAGRGDPRGRVFRSDRAGIGRWADRRSGRVPVSQDDASRGLRRGAGRLPRGRRRAALQSTGRGYGDRPGQHRGPLRQGPVDAAGLLRPAGGDVSRPPAWPKARSASAWSRWKCFPSATSCSSSTPCGFGGRHGLSVRVTLDRLPQNFRRKLAERLDDDAGPCSSASRVRPVLARPTQAMPAAAAAAMPTGASSITTHRARRHAQPLGGDEKDLRIGLAVPHVAAGDDRIEPSPHAQPIDRRGHVLARGRRAHGHAEARLCSAATSSAAPGMAGKSAAMMRRKSVSFSWAMAFTSSSLNRPAPQNWAIEWRAVLPKLSLNCWLADRESAAAGHLHPALIMGLVGIDEHSVHVENCRQFKRHGLWTLRKTMKYGVRGAMRQGEERRGSRCDCGLELRAEY